MKLFEYVMQRPVRVVIVVNQVSSQFYLAHKIKELFQEAGVVAKSMSSNSITLPNTSHILVTREDRVMSGALQGYWFDVCYIENWKISRLFYMS